MLVAALTGRTAEEVTGRGAGLNDAGLLRKQQIIAQALEKYEKEIRSEHALSMLAAFGGLDIAGMAGVCIGGALYHVPVVLDRSRHWRRSGSCRVCGNLFCRAI